MRLAIITTMLVLAVLSISSGRPYAAATSTEEEIAKLKERTDALEKTVVDDPMQPRHTVLSRLAAIEDSVKDIQKNAEAAAKTGSKGDDAIRKSIADLEKDSEHIDKRLKAAEDKLGHEAGGDDTALRDLKRQIEQLDRVLDDLKDRVKRLESKR